MSSEDGKDAAILKELREISNRHSPFSNNGKEIAKKAKSVGPSSSSPDGKENVSESDFRMNGNEFLCQTNENSNLNQYWYSKSTIEVLCNAIREGLSISKGTRVAFLSTPSLFFSLSSKEREQSTLFDFDRSWESTSGYHFYDYNEPINVDESCRGAFDVIVVDPPFISQSVWEKYAVTARMLMKDNACIIATTVDENAVLMKALFGCKPSLFRPSIPHLVYQYSVYANFPSSVLADKNPELQGE